jgi:ribokinase
VTAMVVATGHASADYPALVSNVPAPDTTSVIVRRLTDSWPAFGGCGNLIARWLVAQHGIPAQVVTWVGDDDIGRRYVGRLERSGVDVRGVVITPDARTSTSHLYYTTAGEAVCFFDSGGASRDDPTDIQLDMARNASWLCLTPGPYGVNAALLDAAGPDTKVSWVVKADPVCFPADFIRRILARAALVTFSRGERPFLRDATGREQPFELLNGESFAVETHGQKGVTLFTAEGEHFLPVDPVDVADATGAGDIFHAGTLAHLITQSANPIAASRAGVDAAREFLLDGSWRSL